MTQGTRVLSVSTHHHHRRGLNGRGKKQTVVVKKESLFPRRSLVQKHQRFLKRVYTALTSSSGKPAQTKNTRLAQSLIKSAKPEEIQAICEITQNLLRGSFPSLNRQLLKKFTRHKSALRKLSGSTLRLEKKTAATAKSNGKGLSPSCFIRTCACWIVTQIKRYGAFFSRSRKRYQYSYYI